jgi:hypothetical protein
MQLGINPAMDKLARDNGLGHWSCVSIDSNTSWKRSDFKRVEIDAWSPIEHKRDVLHALREYDHKVPMKPTLVQKPFQYPCEGALYFTQKDRVQVFLTGFLNHHEKQVVGKLPNDKSGKFSFFDVKTGAVITGNTDNDLIMFVWE